MNNKPKFLIQYNDNSYRNKITDCKYCEENEIEDINELWPELNLCVGCFKNNRYDKKWRYCRLFLH